jgi:hypothetical protein
MLVYAHLKSNRRKFLALTGLTPKEFKLVLPAFERAYARRYPDSKTMAGKRRRRQPGGGRKSTLDTPAQKLLFALVYLKTYPLQVLLGEVFEVSQPRANYWIHRLLPVLQQALQAMGVRPERNPREFSRYVRRRGETQDFIIDGTERRRQRPKRKEKQDDFYSPRKHAHTDKNVVISQVKTKRISFLSQTYTGRTHDKTIAETERIRYPRGSRRRQDAGFQGYASRGVEVLQPKKSLGTVNSRRARNDTIGTWRIPACGWSTAWRAPSASGC